MRKLQIIFKQIDYINFLIKHYQNLYSEFKNVDNLVYNVCFIVLNRKKYEA